ncbi:MAG: mechanosensitive ion channel [Cloacibacterium sp.]|jgi:small-conductance mechanosensitive channel|nr:mechanosensitive ion channel [Cloacibacterium sp.]
MQEIKEILEYKLFTIHNYELYVYEVLGVLLILVFSFLVDRFAKKILYKSTRIDAGTQYALYQILHYLIIIATFFLSVRTMGMDISPLLVGSGAILVGIGLGLQNLFLDFISGIIILIDRSIKVGDVLDINGIIGRVTEIKMRTTTLITGENKTIVFPNSLLTKDKLINFSYNDSFVIFNIEVGVDYNTDLEVAKKLLVESAKENKETSTQHEPFVRLEGFGDSSLDLKLYFYSNNLFRASQIRSDIRMAILEKFRKQGINIPYPITTIENISS